MPLDLASLSSIDSFAKLYKSSSSGAGALHILVNNAGVMAIPERETTKEGFERQFGINHLGTWSYFIGHPDRAHVYVDTYDYHLMLCTHTTGSSIFFAFGVLHNSAQGIQQSNL